MSRMPPSFSGGLLCACAGAAPIANSAASTAPTTRFMTNSLHQAALDPRPIISIGSDHAAWLPQRQADASVLVLTFVSSRGGFVYECQNQRDTSKYRILVWFW